jgi:hypothetical protein
MKAFLVVINGNGDRYIEPAKNALRDMVESAGKEYMGYHLVIDDSGVRLVAYYK